MNKNFSFGKRKETQDLRKEKKDITIMYGCIVQYRIPCTYPWGSHRNRGWFRLSR